MRKQGDFNVWMAFYGEPDSGKTEKALEVALNLMAREQMYVIAHDHFSIPDRLHNGRLTHVRRHESIGEARIAMLRDPGGIHSIFTDDAEPVISFARELARKSLEENSTREQLMRHEGRGIPVLLIVDEVVNSKSCSPHRIGEQLNKLVARRRHENVGFIFTSQTPGMGHYRLGTLKTDVYFFRLTDQEDIKFLYKRMGVPREIAEKAPKLSLDDHQYIHYNSRNGVELV